MEHYELTISVKANNLDNLKKQLTLIRNSIQRGNVYGYKAEDDYNYFFKLIFNVDYKRGK